MMWESKAKKDSDFLEELLQTDTEQDPQDFNQPEAKQALPPTQFINEFLTHTSEDSTDDEKDFLSVLGS